MPVFATHLSRLSLVMLAALILSGAGLIFFTEGSFGDPFGMRGFLKPEVSNAPEPASPPRPEPSEKKPSENNPPPKPRTDSASAKLPPKDSAKPSSNNHPPEPPPKESEPSFDAAALENRLEEIAANHVGQYGVAVFDPASGKTAKIAAGKRFGAASIGKLPTLITLYRAAERGEVDLNERIYIRKSDYQSGSGVLINQPPGTSISLRKCAYLLVNESDNTAWNMLTRYLGREEIQSEMNAIGADSTLYWDPNTTTPKDVLLMLKNISDPSFTSKAASDEMLEAMTDTYLEDRIPAGLPSGVRVAHKVGTFGAAFGDAGVVFAKSDDSRKRYFIVVLSGATSELVARDAMREMASAAHEAIVGPKPENDRKDSG